MVDFTKPVQTRDGRKVKIIYTKYMHYAPIIGLVTGEDGLSEDIRIFYTDGRMAGSGNPANDLVNSKTKKQGWINIYPGGHNYGSAYPTKQEAEYAASNNYIATVMVEWEE